MSLIGRGLILKEAEESKECGDPKGRKRRKIRMECQREKVSVFGFEGTPSEKQQSMTEAEKSEAFRMVL